MVTTYLNVTQNDQCNTAIGLIEGIANGDGFCSGVGPFTAANMLQLLGHYSRIPCDSETVRHLHKVHRLQSCTLANVQQHAQQVRRHQVYTCVIVPGRCLSVPVMKLISCHRGYKVATSRLYRGHHIHCMCV